LHSQAFAAGAIIYKLLGCQQEWSHCLIIEHSAPPDKEKNVVELCYISTVFVFPSLSRGVLTVSPFILHVGNDYTHRIYSFKRSTTGSEI
jgi:hypothetical protein